MLPNYAYFEGKIVPYSEAKVGVATHALNYGTGAFAGIRGYWNEDEGQMFIFRPKDHYKRFLNSAKLLLMDLNVTVDDLVEITVQLLRTENLKKDMYIRPLAYKSDEKIGVRLHNLTSNFTIFSIPFGLYLKNDTDASLTFSSWRRVDDNMIPARGKVTGTYVNSALIKSDAVMSGYDEGLVLNADGHLSEGSAMNFFMVRDDVIYTPPITDNILEGITRSTVMELAREEMGIEVVERSIDRTEIYLASEVFLTGTAAQVTAGTSIDHRPIGTGKMGPVASQLRVLFNDVVHGNNPKYRHWNYPVFE